MTSAAMRPARLCRKRDGCRKCDTPDGVAASGTDEQMGQMGQMGRRSTPGHRHRSHGIGPIPRDPGRIRAHGKDRKKSLPSVPGGMPTFWLVVPSRARRFLSPLLHVVLATSMVTIALPTTAAARQGLTVTTLGAAVVDAPASVLGLEGSDGKAADALTEALRKAFNARGYGGGEEMSLSELRLTMGCEKNDDACLAQGGESLGVRRLIYGEPKPAGGGDYMLDL